MIALPNASSAMAQTTSIGDEARAEAEHDRALPLKSHAPARNRSASAAQHG
jgi:hypothetical protein